MKDIAWMNDLKLRGSWGKLGNQEIGLYPSASTYSTNGNLLQEINRGNPDVKWESTALTNIGIDASFFQGKFKIILDLILILFAYNYI